MTSMPPLTPEEEAVIINRRTEMPYSGKYDSFFEKGTYICRQCGALLYRSDDKFDAHCGWPSFDAAFPGAIKQIEDSDGERVEVRCAKCNAHLGHVFQGEQFTDTNIRYCVNSLSMQFVPEKKQ